VACNSATTCYAGLTSVIQAAIGPGTAGFTVIILIGLSISRWILTTLCKAFGQETIAGGIDLVLKCVSIGYVINTVWSLVDGTFLRMGF
jgi:hypothetical protein